MKMIRYLLLGVLVLVIAAVAISFFSLNALIKKGFETAGPAVAKVETRLGAANVLPFSGSGKLSKIFIGNPAGFKTPHAIQINAVAVNLDLPSLKTAKVVIPSIQIDAPDIYIEGGLTNKNNLTALQSNIEAFTSSKSKPQEAKESAASGPAKKVVVKNLTITGAKVHWVSNLTLGQEIQLPLPDIHLQNVGEEKQGITLAELTKLVTNEIFKAAGKVSGKNAGQAVEQLKELGKENLNNAASQLKGLLHK